MQGMKLVQRLKLEATPKPMNRGVKLRTLLTGRQVRQVGSSSAVVELEGTAFAAKLDDLVDPATVPTMKERDGQEEVLVLPQVHGG